MTADQVRSMNSEAADGPAAMVLVKQRRPDVVLVDAKLPVLDGIEAPRWIRGAPWPSMGHCTVLPYKLFGRASPKGEDRAAHRKCPPAWELWSEPTWAGSQGHSWSGLRAPGRKRLTDAPAGVAHFRRQF